MVYVISDLHGYPLGRLQKLLNKADFGKDDFLYILGDVVDRNGDGGVKMLQWLQVQDNVQLILGNHEAMLYACKFILDMDPGIPLDDLTEDQLELLVTYTYDGGGVTLQNLRKLSTEEQNDIFEYIGDCPLYEAITVGDKDFLLVHAGLENFSKDKKLSDYTAHDMLWAWPELSDEYYDDIHTVFGHTPTMTYGDEHDGKIIKTRTWTAIDGGAGYGNEPILLRLDDYKVFKN